MGVRMHVSRTSLSLAVALAFAGLPAYGQALPQGGQVVAGAATISTPAPGAMVIKQTTDKAILNWQSFNIGAGGKVQFDQLSASAVALNRVTGNSRTEIFGKLSANGQVFLVNPNGILFGAGSQVDVGGLVASTLQIKDADFLAGKYLFSDPANRESVVNQGKLAAKDGGILAMIGNRVSNQGEMYAHLGSVVMGAGGTAQLTLADNRLVKFEVTEGALNALAENSGLIRTPGGQVILTAGARDSLIASTVNNTGIIEAQTVENRGGSILLLSGMSAGTTNVAGRLDASAPNGGDGGFIETSGADVRVRDEARVTTDAAQGNAGTWLIDPRDFFIAASGGNITGTALSTALGSGNVQILSSNGNAAGNGDIHVNDNVSWSANRLLTLTAARDININAVITASGSARLTMNTGTGNGADAGVAGGEVLVGINPDGSFKGRVDFPGRTGTNILTINGEQYRVINALGTQGSTNPANLQGINGNIFGSYALGGDIDASATAGWAGGFLPITGLRGNLNGLGHTISNLTVNRPTRDQTGLVGFLDGGTVSNIGITGGSVRGRDSTGALAGEVFNGKVLNSYAAASVNGRDQTGGLVGLLSSSTLRNGHSTGNVAGAEKSGGLVGELAGGSILDSYATGAVSGTYNVGGLVGYNNDAIGNSYATGNVAGTELVGGLVGFSFGEIANTYATGSVTGELAGGLVGLNGWIISNSYASGRVSGGTYTGGLVSFPGYQVNDSYWDIQGTGQAAGAIADAGSIGLGLTSAQMQSMASFSGWDMSATGGSSAVWRIYEGHTAPLLRSFMPALTITAGNTSRVYDGTSMGLSGVTYSIPSASGSASLFGITGAYGTGKTGVGTYSAQVWSSQQGYDVTLVGGALTVTPRSLAVGAAGVDKVYDAGVAATVSLTDNRVSGDVLAISYASASFADKNAGTGKAVSVGGIAMGGADAGNYTLANTTATTTANIAKADLAVTGFSAGDKVYDATTVAALTGTASFTALGSDIVVLSGMSGAFADKNAGNGKAVTLSGTLTGADAGNYRLVPQAGLTADITPASLAVTGLSAADKVYDGTTAATLTGAATVAALGSDSLSLGGTAIGTFADKNAGSDKAVTVAGYTLAGADAGNYTLVQPAGLSATISRRQLVVEADNAAKTYGSSYSFDGTGFRATGLVAGESLSSVSLASAGAAAGAPVTASPYAITASGATGTTGTGFDAANYAISYVDGALTVNRAPLTVTARPDSRVADGTPYAGGNGVSFAGFVNGESSAVLGGSLVYGGSALGASSPGTYAIEPGGLFSGNYAIGYVGGVLTMTAPVSPTRAATPVPPAADTPRAPGLDAALLAAQQFRLDEERRRSAGSRRVGFGIDGAGMALPEGL